MSHATDRRASTQSALVAYGLLLISFAASTGNCSKPSGPVQAILDGLRTRDARSRQILITYSREGVFIPGLRRTADLPEGRQAPHDQGQRLLYERSRVTWACSGRKRLLDERRYDSLTLLGARRHARTTQVYDGEKYLSRYYWHLHDQYYTTLISDDRLFPEWHKGMEGRRQDVGLSCAGEPLSTILSTAGSLQWLGYGRVDSALCAVLQFHSPVVQPGGLTRIWLDTGRGLLLRRVRDYVGTRLQYEIQIERPVEYAPGFFLGKEVVHREFTYPDGATGPVPAFEMRIAILGVRVGPLPAMLFNTEPRPAERALDARTHAAYGRLPVRATDAEVAAAALAAAKLLRGRARSVTRDTPGNPDSLVANDADCGPQCLLAICTIMHVRAGVDELRRLAGSTREGTSLLGLLRAARAKGLYAEGRRLTGREVLKVSDPMIAATPGHFYVVLGFNGANAVLLNPPTECRLMPVAALAEQWMGPALIVRRR